MLLPYGIQTYKRLDLPRVVLRNFFVEDAETVPGKVVLVSRPSLVNYATVGTGPIYGVFFQGGTFGNTLFVVSGTKLYANGIDVGDIGANQPVKMCMADVYLVIATGSSVWTYDGATLAQASFPDGAGITDVTYLASYAIGVRADTRRIYFTLDPTTWDALDYVSAQQSTANLVGIAVVVDQLWLFCQDHTEVFYATGDGTAPFQRVQGRVFDKGAKTRDSIVRMDNTVIWVGHDGVVYRGEGVPVRISDHGIEERIAESHEADLVAWSYTWRGHLFYVLRTTGGTVAFDASTKQWHELSTYGQATWEAARGCLFNGAVICGGDASGKLWTMSDSTHIDASGPLERVFTILINDNVIIDNIAMDCTVGTVASAASPQGMIELRTSRDSGQNWREWQAAGMGRMGQSRTYVRWRRLGMVDESNMVIQIRVTDPVLARVSYLRLNETTAGRSR
jgi:hypothetical protein